VSKSLFLLVGLKDKAIVVGLVEEGKWPSQKLALRTALAENTKPTKKDIPLSCLKKFRVYPV
jgi:hypothetical protein